MNVPSAHEALLRKSYAAFNARDVDTALQALAPDVEWPDQLDGGVVHGREAVGAYWHRQWQVFDPYVEPVRFTDSPEGLVVNVHQVLKGLDGTIISDGVVRHIHTFRDGRVTRMVIRF